MTLFTVRSAGIDVDQYTRVPSGLLGLQAAGSLACVVAMNADEPHLDAQSWALARQVLPELNGMAVSVTAGADHHVVVAPGIGIVRVSRQPGTAPLMRRRREVLIRLEQQAFPFAIPTPLSEVAESGDICAMAMRWLPGSPHQRGHGDPAVLAAVLDSLRSVDITALVDVVEPAHAYAGGHDWEQRMLDAVAELPEDVRSEARHRVAVAAALPSVEASFIHGDLGGDNMFWNDQGELVGVIDWDWAAAWDPAIDAACLSWHGWDTVRSAVDTETFRRARIWYLTFPLEQLVGARLRPPGHHDVVNRAAAWIRRTS
jgi:Phosphotransferase enzyme family